MKTSRPNILSSPIFILAVGLLLFNDFYLKYTYSSYLTGKLSDFAGLFIFPYFFSSLRIKYTKIIYIITVILFIFWKSEFSQGVIEWVQTMGLGINRVVDYTDLVALAILPFSYRQLKEQVKSDRRVHKALIIPLSLVSLFAIWATTLPREKVDLHLPVSKVFVLKINKSYFFNLIQAGHRYSDTPGKNLQDSLFYLHFNIVRSYQADVKVLSTITLIDSSRTRICLDTILYGDITGGLFSGVDKDDITDFKSISAAEFERYFERNFIVPIKKKKAEYIYYDNKEIDDLYQEK